MYDLLIYFTGGATRQHSKAMEHQPGNEQPTGKSQSGHAAVKHVHGWFPGMSRWPSWTGMLP
jgi:hypothetical protein